MTTHTHTHLLSPCDMYCYIELVRIDKTRTTCGNIAPPKNVWMILSFASCLREKDSQLGISYIFILKATDVVAVAFSAGREGEVRRSKTISPLTHSVGISSQCSCVPFTASCSLSDHPFYIPDVIPRSLRITFSPRREIEKARTGERTSRYSICFMDRLFFPCFGGNVVR